jgi:hypothetical protein
MNITDRQQLMEQNGSWHQHTAFHTPKEQNVAPTADNSRGTSCVYRYPNRGVILLYCITVKDGFYMNLEENAFSHDKIINTE